MKTVAAFAKELDVSVQTIYRRLNKVKQINDEGLTVKRDGITYITALGENAIGRSTDVKHIRIKLIGVFNCVKPLFIRLFNIVKPILIRLFNIAKGI